MPGDSIPLHLFFITITENNGELNSSFHKVCSDSQQAHRPCWPVCLDGGAQKASAALSVWLLLENEIFSLILSRITLFSLVSSFSLIYLECLRDTLNARFVCSCVILKGGWPLPFRVATHQSGVAAVYALKGLSPVTTLRYSVEHQVVCKSHKVDVSHSWLIRGSLHFRKFIECYIVFFFLLTFSVSFLFFHK